MAETSKGRKVPGGLRLDGWFSVSAQNEMVGLFYLRFYKVVGAKSGCRLSSEHFYSNVEYDDEVHIQVG